MSELNAENFQKSPNLVTLVAVVGLEGVLVVAVVAPFEDD